MISNKVTDANLAFLRRRTAILFALAGLLYIPSFLFVQNLSNKLKEQGVATCAQQQISNNAINQLKFVFQAPQPPPPERAARRAAEKKFLELAAKLTTKRDCEEDLR